MHFAPSVAISPKAMPSVLALLEEKATTEDEISRLCAAHGFSPAWERFKMRFLNV